MIKFWNYELEEISDKNWTIFAILINWVYNRKFNEDYLRNFDSPLYDWLWNLDLKKADYLSENLPLFF